MPIMASAHFGQGDKSKWGYLGSRKAVFDEWNNGKGKSRTKLAKLFGVTPGDVRDFILEYQLYLKALSFPWTHTEKDILLKPNLAFNPPVRFLQASQRIKLRVFDYQLGRDAFGKRLNIASSPNLHLLFCRRCTLDPSPLRPRGP